MPENFHSCGIRRICATQAAHTRSRTHPHTHTLACALVYFGGHMVRGKIYPMGQGTEAPDCLPWSLLPPRCFARSADNHDSLWFLGGFWRCRSR
eukprot:COSAG05_NODE_87_length_20404_cov_42.272051_15_plen_94_part_00